MAYNIKYRISYYRKSGGQTTIDILQRDYAEDSAGGITDLLAYGQPFEVTREGAINNIYNSIVGSGATIRVMATPLQLVEFFTDDPQEFIVKAYNGASGSTLIWQGFINPEIYTANYSSALRTPIEIYCNDGIQVLSSIAYKSADSTGEFFTGVETISGILQNILDKLEIAFTQIYTSMDLAIVLDEVIESTNIFLYLSLPNENFIDESSVAISCRDVLDYLFGGLGQVLKFKGEYIYIYDPINLHDTSKGKHYDVTPTIGGHEGASLIGGYLDISAGDIKWNATSTVFDMASSVNEVIVKYDPYNFADFNYNFNDVTNWDTEGTFVDATTYWYNYGVTFIGWDTDNSAGINFAGVKASQYTEATYMILVSNEGSLITYDVPFSNITQDQDLAIKISFDAYVQTRDGTINIFSDGASVDIYQVKVPIGIKIGNQYWNGGNSWGDTSEGEYMQPLYIRQEGIGDASFAADPTQSKVNDIWTPVSIMAVIKQTQEEDLIQGDIAIEILSDIKTFFADPITPAANVDDVYYVFLRDFRVEIVNAATGKNVGNSGVRESALISANLTGKSAFEINTKVGSGTFGCSRGALKTDQQVITGTNIEGLYRLPYSSGIETYSTPQLILQSFLSQYQQPRYVLHGTLNVVDYLLALDMKLIKHTDHLGSKAFYIVKSTYYDREEETKVDMVEVTDTREDIT